MREPSGILDNRDQEIVRRPEGQAIGFFRRLEAAVVMNVDALPDDLGRHARHDAVGRNILQDHRIGANHRRLPDGNRPEQLRSCADDATIADHRHPPSPRPSADRDIVPDRHIAPDPGALVQHDAQPAVCQLGAFAKFYRHRNHRPTQEVDGAVRQLGNHRNAALVTPITDSIDRQCVHR